MSTLNSLPVLKPKKVESTEQPKSDKELERLRKIRERIIRNRASANASRQKKKQYMELLEKKNKELTQHKEKIDKENQILKNENENLKLQVQYLTQALNRMNALYNDSQNNSIEQVQIPNILLQNNNTYSLPLTDNNFTSDINSPESLSSVSLSSPIFNDIQVIPSTSTIQNNNIINTNVNNAVNNINTLSPQSSVGEPAALTNENSLQRTLFYQRIMYQILQTVMLTKSLTTYLMMTLAFIIQTSAYRPLNNNNSYRNLYQKKNYIQTVPISVQKSQYQTLQYPDYHKNKYSSCWNNKSYYWKDKIS
ncbi:hypothetical protein PIROE2DRAFT_69049 [Piromyces sp. E2]|nr:hypothetical protein PIROE2DRAFT_69049 [Piromyces sp. E2]|eukprot:OUM65691.1 hypothetical protein PIROE2DRAFT_69049 [Piromyces sp. E2]